MLTNASTFSFVDFHEYLISLLQTHFTGFDSIKQTKLTGLLTIWFQNGVSATSILKFSRHFQLELVKTQHDLMQILQNSKARSTIRILPSITKLLTQSSEKIKSNYLHKVCSIIHQSSLPTCDENKRMAASQCINLMEILLQDQYSGDAYSESLKL